MLSLTWSQIHTWRLSQHHLLRRAERGQMLDVVSQICGLHAQLMSSAELSLGIRVQGLFPSEVQAALWEERRLVKTWAMRGTLHLVAADDFPLYIAALSTLTHFRRGSWLKYHGVSLAELETLIEGVRETLNGSGITREQLAEAIAARMAQPKLRELLSSGWGALLKPAAFQGYLCFGPNQGQNVTFVQPDHWLAEWSPIEPDDAFREILRRYLAAYGPATIDEFARWWGLEPSKAKRYFRLLADEVEEIEVEGWQGWALASTLEQMQTVEPSEGLVRLLPYFDPYTVALARQCQYLMDETHKGRVYRPQGWISPVVLVDGRIEGVWETDKKRAKTVVTVEMFNSPSSEVKEGIEAEARRLRNFLETEVELVYTQR